MNCGKNVPIPWYILSRSANFAFYLTSVRETMAELLNADVARQQILERIPPPDFETIPTEQALNRVLAGDVNAPMSLPAFPNAAMDGYAVRSTDTGNAPIYLRVAMDIPAGQMPFRELQP